MPESSQGPPGARRRKLRHARAQVKEEVESLFFVLGCRSPVSTSDTETLRRVCSDVLAPLIGQDHGELYLVDLSQERIALHLAGKCAGCPGLALTTAEVIEPAIRALAPHIQIVVTGGIRLPPGATLVACEPKGATAAGPEAPSGAAS